MLQYFSVTFPLKKRLYLSRDCIWETDNQSQKKGKDRENHNRRLKAPFITPHHALADNQ